MQKTVSNIFFSSQQALEFVQYFRLAFGCHFDGWDCGIKRGDGPITLSDHTAEYKHCHHLLRRWRVAGSRVEIDVDDTGELFLLHAGGPHGTIDEVVERYIRKYCGMSWG